MSVFLPPPHTANRKPLHKRRQIPVVHIGPVPFWFPPLSAAFAEAPRKTYILGEAANSENPDASPSLGRRRQPTIAERIVKTHASPKIPSCGLWKRSWSFSINGMIELRLPHSTSKSMGSSAAWTAWIARGSEPRKRGPNHLSGGAKRDRHRGHGFFLAPPNDALTPDLPLQFSQIQDRHVGLMGEPAAGSRITGERDYAEWSPRRVPEAR